MNVLLYVFAGLLGVIIGSFLNVVIFRLHTNKISKGRSKCMYCGHKLSSRDLIPLLSYLFLGGRCRYCKSKLSKQYIVVEAITGVVFTLIAYKLNIIFGLSILGLINFVFYSFIFSLLLAMAVYDIKHFILPWKIMKIFLLASFLFPLVYNFLGDGISIQNFISGFIIAFPFWVLWYFSKGKLIGFGDIELMCGFGFLFGISGGFASVMLSFWIGAILIFIKVILERKLVKGKTQIPFGPFLVAGAFLTFLLSLNMASFIFVLS